MQNTRFAKLANYSKDDSPEKRSLSAVLDSLSEILDIQFGSLTVRFFNGKWSPKIEIQENVLREVQE
jgi:hypothetical protein